MTQTASFSRGAPRRAAATLGLLLLGAAASGCAREAGSVIQSASFGTATMNNHVVQSCAAGPVEGGGKYAANSAACADRRLDGEYARAVYTGYIVSAAPDQP